MSRTLGIACVAAALVGGAAAAGAYTIPPTKALAGPVSGTVTVRTSPNRPPVRLAPGVTVPSGSVINATNGTAVLVVLQHGVRRRVSITGGEFVFTENPHTGSVVLTLALPLTGCPPASSAVRSHAVMASRPKRRPRKGPRQRQITVSDSGGTFGTKGQYVATSTEGTRWKTADTCGATTVTVYSGRVFVTSLVTGRRITISAGQHYTVHK